MASKQAFLKWWLIFGMVIVASGICYGTGVHIQIYEKDASYLSFAILGLFYYMTLWCGYKTWKASCAGCDVQKLGRWEEVGWFFADLCMGIGMTGTIIGFVMMLGQFDKVNVSNMSSVQTFIKTFGTGMATALYTTLIGLIASLVLKLQYFNLGQSLSATRTTICNRRKGDEQT